MQPAWNTCPHVLEAEPTLGRRIDDIAAAAAILSKCVGGQRLDRESDGVLGHGVLLQPMLPLVPVGALAQPALPQQVQDKQNSRGDKESEGEHVDDNRVRALVIQADDNAGLVVRTVANAVGCRRHARRRGRRGHLPPTTSV
eukprot:scaffold27724_cov97-Isochrysis_galbana.AAC.1